MTPGAWLLAAVLTAAPATAPSDPPAPDPRASAEWWIETYGELRPDVDFQAAAAARLLERLWRAAGQRLALPPRLVVLAESRPGLLALALPDNSVLISRAGLEFCLQRNLRPDAAEARLGLVLAHELDHILRVDDWHVAAFSANLLEDGELQTLTTSREVRLAAEFRADANAVLLLSAAGLDPALALRPDGFIEQWAQARGAAVAASGATHPGARRRVETMRLELERLVAALPLFREGAAQLDAGRGEAALAAFEQFHRRTRYAGKELLANLGLAHYQIGLSALARCDPSAAFRFRLGTVVEHGLEFTGGRYRGTSAGRCLRSPRVAQALDTAAARLQEAAAADPGHLPARLNLIAVLVVANRVPLAYAEASALAEALRARQFAERLPALDPRRLAVRNSAAVCAYLMRREVAASADEALRELSLLQETQPHEPNVAYDLARVLQETGQSGRAREAWARYLRLDGEGPYAAAARTALAGLGAPAPDRGTAADHDD